ncbi:transcriptional regulator [candidate division WOR-3 bacterium]|nr:transcriptional regulator [candidate division WOR-3 bacterium]
MEDFNPAEVNKLIHAPIRLGIMTILNSVRKVNFLYLRKKLDVTDGNLSSHMEKLEEAGYVSVKKTFLDKKPNTIYRITEKGKKAFRSYLEHLEKILEGSEN